MTRVVAAGLAAGLAVAAAAAAADRSTVRLVGSRTATAGVPWSAQVVVRPAPRTRPAVLAVSAGRRRVAFVRALGRGRFAVRLLLPAGTWRLQARLGGRTHGLGTLRAAPRRAPAAGLTNVADVVVAPDGSLFLADLGNRIFRLDRASRRLTVVAGTGRNGFSGDGGAATRADIGFPVEVAADPRGGVAVVAGETRVRHVDPAGLIRTLAGTATPGWSGDGGPATAASLDQPTALAYDTAGNLYVAELGGRIRRVDAVTGTISTVAGVGGGGFGGDGGPARSAQLNRPHGLAVAPDGTVFFADTFNNRIRRIDPTGAIATVAGTGVAGFAGDSGPAAAAELNSPVDVSLGPDGSLYVADYSNNRIRRIDPTGTIRTATAAEGPNGVAVDAAGAVYFCERERGRVRRLDPGTGSVVTVAGR